MSGMRVGMRVTAGIKQGLFCIAKKYILGTDVRM